MLQKNKFVHPVFASIIKSGPKNRTFSNHHIDSLQVNSNLARIIHTHPFNGCLSGTTQASRYQKGKTNLDFTEARDSEWQWHQLGHMQVCRPTNSVKALKALL